MKDYPLWCMVDGNDQAFLDTITSNEGYVREQVRRHLEICPSLNVRFARCRIEVEPKEES